jgi:hypothetical protein
MLGSDEKDSEMVNAISKAFAICGPPKTRTFSLTNFRAGCVKQQEKLVEEISPILRDLMWFFDINNLMRSRSGKG